MLSTVCYVIYIEVNLNFFVRMLKKTLYHLLHLLGSVFGPTEHERLGGAHGPYPFLRASLKHVFVVIWPLGNLHSGDELSRKIIVGSHKLVELLD